MTNTQVFATEVFNAHFAEIEPVLTKFGNKWAIDEDVAFDLLTGVNSVSALIIDRSASEIEQINADIRAIATQAAAQAGYIVDFNDARWNPRGFHLTNA